MSKVNLRIAFSFVFGSIILVAFQNCAGDPNGAGGGANSSASPTEILHGTWATAPNSQCTSNSSSSSDINTFALVEGSFSVLTTYFGTSNCSGSPTLTASMKAPLTIGSAVAGASDANEFTMTFQSLIYTVTSDSMVSTWNSISMCGRTNWVKNVSQDVSALACAGNIVGRATYSTLQRSGSTSIYFAKASGANDGSDVSKRMTVIDSSNPYVLQK